MEDEGLAARVATGDMDAFRTLYHRYLRRTYTWCAHVLGPGRAEDAIQEIFLELWQHAGRFDPERGTFVSWFTAITRNHLGHELRREGVRRRRAGGLSIAVLLAAGASIETSPEEIACGREEGRALAQALGALPEEQRSVLVLSYFAGLSQSQIASRQHLPLGTVKKRVGLGIRKLRSALDEWRMPPAEEAAP